MLEVAVRVVLATLGAAYGLGPALAAAQTLPDSYVGVWKNMEGQSASCSESDWDGPAHADTHIRIAPGEIHAHEGACRFTSVRAGDFGDARVSMSCASEGDAYQTSEIWSLTEIRGHRMLVTTSLDREDGATIVYQHCPASE